MIDTSKYVGEMHEVALGGRTMTVTVTDGGPCPFWDGRGMLKLTVAFTDGRRSHWASADAAAGEVASKIYSPYSVGMMGGDGWEPLIERSQRDQGRRKNGSTMFTFTVFCGLLDRSARIAKISRELAEVEARYAASKAQYARG
jgi:hypothetical protein